jgi:WG containing repeat
MRAYKLLTESCSIALVLCVGMILEPAYASRLFGIVESNGRVIVPIKYTSIASNHDGSFCLSVHPDQLHPATIDKDGHNIGKRCPPLAASHGTSQKSQIADTSKPTLHFKYSVPQAKIVEGPKGIGVTDFAGRIIIPPIYIGINPIFVTRKADDDRIYVATVQNHHAPAATPTKFLIKTPGKTEDPELYTASTMDPWFFIVFDRNGKELTRLSAATRVNSRFFQEGLLKIGPPAKKTQSFMDAKGKIALTLQGYDSADTFSNGLSYVGNAAGSSWVDRTGKKVIGPFKNACLGRFGKDRGIVQFYRNGKTFVGAVDRAGVFRIPADYESLSEVPGDRFLAEKNQRLQLIDKNNNLICQLPED